VNSASFAFKFAFFFLVQLDLDVEMSGIKRLLLPIDTASSQALGVPSERESPDRCVVHLSRIVDLENRVSTLKPQTRNAMEQAKKSSDLSKQVSSLDEQMSILMAKIVQLKEWDSYMTKIIQTTSEQLQCMSFGAPENFCRSFLFVLTLLLFSRHLLGSYRSGSSSRRASCGS
jgi:hypothetical protein